MIVNNITEVMIAGVYDRGIPNQERIVLFLNQAINLGQYGLMVGVRADEKRAFPIKDNLFWFGDALVNKSDWIFIYTGPGEPKSTTIPNTDAHLYSIHWGKERTIFNHQDLVPILFRVDAVEVPLSLPALPSAAQKGGNT